jgi:hypothetical protein
MSSIYESVFIDKIPYWVFALSVLGVASTSIGVECLTQCKCKGRGNKKDNLNYLSIMTAAAVLGIILSGFAIIQRF